LANRLGLGRVLVVVLQRPFFACKGIGGRSIGQTLTHWGLAA
jgi:hypothetical protein